MRKPFFVLVLFLVFLSSCASDCSKLREKDEKILSDFKELQAQNLPESDLRYVAKLRILYEQEQALLRQVRKCDISDPADYNYWYGERLKYPSELEKTYIKLKP